MGQRNTLEAGRHVDAGSALGGVNILDGGGHQIFGAGLVRIHPAICRNTRRAGAFGGAGQLAHQQACAFVAGKQGGIIVMRQGNFPCAFRKCGGRQEDSGR